MYLKEGIYIIYTNLLFAVGNNIYGERNDLLNDLPKRIPLGFTGVRGKKEYEPTNDFDKRAPSGFMGVRGKKESENFISDEQTFDKRAPSGFMGVRGKKESENFMDDELEFDKRIPKGFMGVRGKKESDNFIDDELQFDKRIPKGFMGVRGKKVFIPYDTFEKRLAGNGVFGVRGKKQPARSPYFGIRGKKYPYEFRGKFVGVRGKKSDVDYGWYGNEIMDNNIGYGEYDHHNDLDLYELMYLLAQGGNGNELNFQKWKVPPTGLIGSHG